MIAGMLWSYLPRGTYQNNSCYNGTLESRWQFSNQDEQVSIDCSISAVWVTPAECYYVPFLGMLLKHAKT